MRCWLKQTLVAFMESDRCVCFRLMRHNDSYALPFETICQSLESILLGCVAIEHKSEVAVFLSIVDSHIELDASLHILESFLENIDFIAGISNEFVDMHNAEHYYAQAGCAIEAGMKIDPGKRYYLFSEYALIYMLESATEHLRPEFLCAPGLIKLRERDESVSGDYWTTLKVYLDNKMNTTQAAKQLYLHRSTLIKNWIG